MSEEVEQKVKRFAIKILEKDFDQITAYQEKWSKQKKEEFSIDEVVDYVMQTAMVRIAALEKYARKQKAARKEEAAKRPPKVKKTKAAKAPKTATPRKKKKKVATKTASEQEPETPASTEPGSTPTE